MKIACCVGNLPGLGAETAGVCEGLNPKKRVFGMIRKPWGKLGWSHNLGHENKMTTFIFYGAVACQQQGEIICDLAMPQPDRQSDAEGIAEAVVRKMRENGVEGGDQERAHALLV